MLLSIAGGWILKRIPNALLLNTQKETVTIVQKTCSCPRVILMAPTINQKRLNHLQTGYPEQKLLSHAAKTRRHV